MFFRSPSNSSSTNRLFRSSSGHYYRIIEIVEYIQKQKHYPAIFCDFKNTRQDTHPTLNMFTVDDLRQLLTVKEVFIAVRHHEAFMTLREWVLDIRDETLKLMRELAHAAECLENLGVAFNSTLLGKLLTEPLMKLYEHINENTHEAHHERQILSAITSHRGILSTYSLGRTTHLIADLHAFACEQKCGAGFNRCLAGVYAAIKSCHLYQESMWQLAPNDAARARLFENRKRRRTIAYSLPMEAINGSQSSNHSSTEGSLPPTQDMNDWDPQDESPPNKKPRRTLTRA